MAVYHIRKGNATMIDPNPVRQDAADQYIAGATFLHQITGGYLLMCWSDKLPRFHRNKTDRDALPRPLYFNLPPIDLGIYQAHITSHARQTPVNRRKRDETGQWGSVQEIAGDIAWTPLRFGFVVVDIDAGEAGAVKQRIGIRPTLQYRSSPGGGTHLVYPVNAIDDFHRRGQPIWSFHTDGTHHAGDIRIAAGYARIPSHNPEVVMQVAEAIQCRWVPDAKCDWLSIDALDRLCPPPKPPTAEEIQIRQAAALARMNEYTDIPPPDVQIEMIADFYGLMPDSSVQGYRGVCPLCHNPRADSFTASVGSRGGVVIGCFACRPTSAQRIELIHQAVPKPTRTIDAKQLVKPDRPVAGSHLLGLEIK